MLTGEIGEAALLARDGRLAEAALHVGRPIRFMLASPVADAAEVMRRVGDEAWIEDKYDGIRAQLHIEEDGASRLFSRDLNDVTRSFPEIAEAAEALRDEAPLVIDGELVPWREGSVLDFAVAPDAPRSRAAVGGAVGEVPVVLVAFDLLHARRAGSARDTLRERRARPRGAVGCPERTGERMLLSHLATARSAEEVDRHFDDARERHNEGPDGQGPRLRPTSRGAGAWAGSS